MNRRDITKFGKFTRGEKCIFLHLVLTFVLILISIFVYFVHLCLVNHIGNSVFYTRRVSQLYPKNKEYLIPDYLPVGILSLNITPPRVICSTIHFRERWSIAPAHCVIIRTDPDLVELLPKWRIKYTTIDFQDIATEIKRSIAHPHFNRDDFSNNIGLLEHIISVPIHQYTSLPRPKTSFMEFGADNMQLVQWTPFTTINKGPLVLSNRFRLHFVNIMDRPKCINYMAPVVDLRSYEFCVTLKDRINVNFDHGAALLQGYNVTGFFSWGERQGKTLPFIIVYIPKFKDWLEDIVSIQNILL